MSGNIEPIVGRYLHLEYAGRQHRIYFERPARAFRWSACTRPEPTRRQYRGLLNDAAVTAAVPRHRLRPAVARQVLAAGRLAGRGIPADRRLLHRHHHGGRRRAGAGHGRW